MRTLLKSLTILFAGTTLFLTLSLYLGSQGGIFEPESSAQLGFKVYGSLSGILALVFGFWTGTKEVTMQGHASRTVKFSRIIVLLCLGALIQLSFFE